MEYYGTAEVYGINTRGNYVALSQEGETVVLIKGDNQSEPKIGSRIAFNIGKRGRNKRIVSSKWEILPDGDKTEHYALFHSSAEHLSNEAFLLEIGCDPLQYRFAVSDKAAIKSYRIDVILKDISTGDVLIVGDWTNPLPLKIDMACYGSVGDRSYILAHTSMRGVQDLLTFGGKRVISRDFNVTDGARSLLALAGTPVREEERKKLEQILSSLE